jgi:selenophosphate synthase
MFKRLIVGALISFSCSPVLADGQSFSSSSNAQNNQNNSGTVNLAPMGGSNSNYQINSVSNSQFQFGHGVSCPTPEIGIGVFGGSNSSFDSSYNNGSNNYGATVMLTTPIGGDIGRHCEKLVSEITKQRQLDTKVSMIHQCAEFARSGVKLDTTQFPEFAVCSAVTVAGRSAVSE